MRPQPIHSVRCLFALQFEVPFRDLSFCLKWRIVTTGLRKRCKTVGEAGAKPQAVLFRFRPVVFSRLFKNERLRNGGNDQLRKHSEFESRQYRIDFMHTGIGVHQR